MRQGSRRQSGAIRRPLVDLLEAKARQASKLAEIRETLKAAGCGTTAKQAAVLGVSRPTAWVVLNRDRRAGPSAKVIKRILSSPNLPAAVRRKVEEYVEEKIRGHYGHSKRARSGFAISFVPQLSQQRSFQVNQR
jgi:hypothetical protein